MIELTDEQARAAKMCIEKCEIPHHGAHGNLLDLLTPKLAEPTNFGAIVKDKHEIKWVRSDETLDCWMAERTGYHWKLWEEIESPTLIYPGVEK